MEEILNYNNALRELRDKMKTSLLIAAEVREAINNVDAKNVGRLFYWIKANNDIMDLIRLNNS